MITGRTEITDFGDIKRVQGPLRWGVIGEDATSMTSRADRQFVPPEATDVSINVFYRGLAVGETAAAHFSNMLAQANNSAMPQKLTAEQIQSLSEIFGYNTVGDNQYSNDEPKGSHNYPVFHMANAEIVSLNGRSVVKVIGTFQDEHGATNSEYVGFFFPNKANAKQIQQIFLQAPTRGKIMMYTKDFEECLKTLEWR